MLALNLSSPRKPVFQAINYHLALFTVCTGSPILLAFTNPMIFRLYAQIWYSIRTREWHIEPSKTLSLSKSSKSHLPVDPEATAKVQNDVQIVVDTCETRTVETERSQKRTLLQSMRRQAKLQLKNNLRVLSSIRSEEDSALSTALPPTEYSAHEIHSMGLQDDEHLGVVVAADTIRRISDILPTNESPEVKITAMQENHTRLMEKVNSISRHSVKLTASVASLLESINRRYPRPDTL